MTLFFILLCTYPVASIEVTVTSGVKRLFLRHTLQYSRVCFLLVHVFFILFHSFSWTRNNTAIRLRLFEPDKSHTEGVFFRGKKPKSRVVLHKTQVAGGIIVCTAYIVRVCVCVNFNPAMLLHLQQ